MRTKPSKDKKGDPISNQDQNSGTTQLQTTKNKPPSGFLAPSLNRSLNIPQIPRNNDEISQVVIKKSPFFDNNPDINKNKSSLSQTENNMSSIQETSTHTKPSSSTIEPNEKNWFVYSESSTVEDKVVEPYTTSHIRKYSGPIPTKVYGMTMKQIENIPSNQRLGYIFMCDEELEEYEPKDYFPTVDNKEYCVKRKESASRVYNYMSEKRRHLDDKEDIKQKLNIRNLCDALASNVVFDSGFRISRYDVLSTKFCFCPISSIFRKYNTAFDLGELFGRHCVHTCSQDYPMKLRDLMIHIKGHCQTSFYHQIVYRFMTNLYDQHWTIGLKHEALYETSTIMLYKSYQFEMYSMGFHIDRISKALSRDKLKEIEPDVEVEERLTYVSRSNKDKREDIPSTTSSLSNEEFIPDSPIDINIPKNHNIEVDCVTTFDTDITTSLQTNQPEEVHTTTTNQNKSPTNTLHTGHFVHPSRLENVARLNVLCHQDTPAKERRPNINTSLPETSTRTARHSNPYYKRQQSNRTSPYNINSRSKSNLGDRWQKPSPATQTNEQPSTQQEQSSKEINIRGEESTTEWHRRSSDESMTLEHESKKSSTVIQLNHKKCEQTSTGHTTTFDITTTTTDSRDNNTTSDMDLDEPIINDNTISTTETSNPPTMSSCDKDRDNNILSSVDIIKNKPREKRKLTRKGRDARRKKKKKIIDVLKRKGLVDEEYINGVLVLSCTKTMKTAHGIIQSFSMTDENNDINDAVLSNVTLEIYIKKTQDTVVYMNASDYKDILANNNNGNKHCMEIFEVKDDNEACKKRKNKNNTTSSVYLNNPSSACVPTKELPLNTLDTTEYKNSILQNSSLIFNKFQTVTSITVNNIKDECFLPAVKIQNTTIHEDIKNCSSCKKQLPSNCFLDKLANTSKYKYSFLEYDGTILCKNCSEKVLQLSKSQYRNELLKVFMEKRILMFEQNWDYDNVISIDNIPYLQSLLNYSFSSNELISGLKKKVKVYTCHIKNMDNIKDYKNHVNELKGADLSLIRNESIYKDKAITLPNDCDLGLVLFNRNKNFVLMDQLSLQDEDVINISKEESHSIIKGVTGGRSGAASGIVYPETNSHSLSKVTQKPNSFMIAQKKSVGMVCVYENAQGEIKSFNSVYNDLYMNRLQKKKKERQLFSNPSYRRIVLQEMISRTQSYIIVYHFGLFQDMTINPFEKLNSILDKQPLYTYSLQCFQNMGYSFFESALLVWSSLSGEMRNHQSVSAHCDGNTSHEIETLTLFPRIAINSQTKTYSCPNRDMFGYLYFPLDALVLKYLCAKHIIHCNLKLTLHLPDSSRDDTNWSKLQGP